MCKKLVYSFWSKNYTLRWWASAGLAFLILEVFLLKFQSHWEGYALTILILFIQYLITEKRAQYWPIVVDEAGLLFYAQTRTHMVPWSSINDVQPFPTNNFMPLEWHQAMMSSGIILSTGKQNFVIYRKINGYEGILSAIKKHT